MTILIDYKNIMSVDVPQYSFTLKNDDSSETICHMKVKGMMIAEQFEAKQKGAKP